MAPEVRDSLEAALARLPHREPFRFITRLVALEPGRAGEAVWSVRGGEGFFEGHFPGDPIVPGVLICEALAQLSGLVGLHGSGAVAGRLAHTDVRFDGSVRPPAEIILRAAQIRALGQLRQFEVMALVGEEVVARGQLTLAAVDQQ
jgi:3-hydroxyacyl-[acyl-carrier-protein] dehydratase